MDMTSLGSGGFGGLFISILTALGIRESVKKKQDIAICNERHKIVSKLEEDVCYIRQRVDEINDYLRNHARFTEIK